MSDWVRQRDELLNLSTGAEISIRDEPPWSLVHTTRSGTGTVIRTLDTFVDLEHARAAFDGVAVHLNATSIEYVFRALEHLREIDEIHRQIWK